MFGNAEPLQGDARIRYLEDENERLRRMVVNSAGWHAPCPICGYHGSGFYQGAVHECAKLINAE